MKLPVMPPVEPMLAKSASAVPVGDYLYEPKWDGYRCIVFRDGGEFELGSRGGKSLSRYFPELLDALAAGLPPRCVVDGEIVVTVGGRLDFDRLADRIHPADSRVQLLAKRTPASFIAFDLLALDDEDLTGRPFSERRAALAALFEGRTPEHVKVTRVTRDAALARTWFERFEGAGLDGVVAKPLDGTYRPNERTMVKIKHERTADAVVAGYRLHKSGPVVGSLMLGLYGADGVLNYVGGSSAFTMARRAALVGELAPLLLEEGQPHPWLDVPEDDEHRRPGALHRWNAGKDTSFVPLRPELVCEVRYDQLQADRFRHNARFVRWRPDRDARSCSYDQLDVPAAYDLADVFE
ncbi:MAG TPA: ATP-dependent DNA ligase [Actinocrinis sp.]|jgi:ATP-dependent DNA ligase|uniref:ATP-dependent DNA ligase n=1 Tax=Actinocrinis sp. TaxID=1920516 RepID=UPI002DDD62F0|nr:ATP-dependent DNA ligase [Actinocrinis sp.]HEV3171706.1 ATP-dependent DNA ligase [Actinocrinis sp.]